MEKRKVIITLAVIAVCLGACFVYIKSDSISNQGETRSPSVSTNTNGATLTDNIVAVKKMGFPTVGAVPDGFERKEDITIYVENWCEIAYENTTGDFLSLDCYETDSFDGDVLNLQKNSPYPKPTRIVTINGSDGEVYERIFDSDINVIVWNDDGNNASCVLCSNITIEEMIASAESIEYDIKRMAPTEKEIEIIRTPKGTSIIEDDASEKYLDVIEKATKSVFDIAMESDSAIKGFELESLHKSFEFALTDDFRVEVYDYDYYMKAGKDIAITGGMNRSDDGNIRGMSWLSGQVASIVKNGKIIKSVTVSQQDVKLDPEARDPKEIKDIIMRDLKTPRCIVWDSVKGYTVA